MADTLNITRNNATSLDAPPVYDKITTEYISDVWSGWFATFVESLSATISQTGFFIPKLTTAERNTIQAPQIGQFIFNTTTDTLQIYLDNGGSPRWENVTTVP